jgi:cytochrome c oxidase assembly protein subunit 15
MVMMMVVIGGVTRLTGSGLSITEWKPLMGAIPPLTHDDWLEVFGKYQSSPQYQLVNKGMTLAGFQWIFFWEYFHRLIGRMMGIVFLLPWAWFWFKGYFDKKWAGRFLLGFMLGGLQGLMGWVMVASGLVDQPQVSHFRLAAHLVLAFFILGYFWRMGWLYNTESQAEKKSLAMSEKGGRKTLLALKKSLNVLLVILSIQIIYGAFVAGLRAGYMYNTFPDMEGQFFPLGALSFEPLWRNILENSLMVQWLHRMLGWTLALGCIGLYLQYRQSVPKAMRGVLAGLVAVVLTQFSLGVLTLLLKVSLPLAVIHQVGASVVLLFLLWLRWEIDFLLKPEAFKKIPSELVAQA